MKQHKIWYLSTEVAPFAKTGGLGDVCSSFPKALKMKDYEIRATMPKYKIINERKYILREVIRLKEIPVTINICRTLNLVTHLGSCHNDLWWCHGVNAR